MIIYINFTMNKGIFNRGKILRHAKSNSISQLVSNVCLYTAAWSNTKNVEKGYFLFMRGIGNCKCPE